MIVATVLVVTEGEENWSAYEGIFFADFALEEALIGPVEQTEVAAVDDEPGWASVGLDDVFEFRAGVFETGGDMFDDGFAEDFIKLGGFEFEMASGVDFGGKFEEFGDILAGFGASDEDRGIWEEVKITLEFIEDMVGVVDEVSFREDDDNSLASVDDLAGERLVEFGMRFGRIDEESADVGLLDGGEGAEGGKFLDANFAFAGFAETSSVENFESAIMKADFDAVDVAGSSLTRADESLLFLAEGVEEAGFADVGAADESDFERILVRLGLGRSREILVNGGFEVFDSLAGGGGDAEGFGGLDAEAEKFSFGERFSEVRFIEQKEDWFLGLEGGLGDVFIFIVGVF